MIDIPLQPNFPRNVVSRVLHQSRVDRRRGRSNSTSQNEKKNFPSRHAYISSSVDPPACSTPHTPFHNARIDRTHSNSGSERSKRLMSPNKKYTPRVAVSPSQRRYRHFWMCLTPAFCCLHLCDEWVSLTARPRTFPQCLYPSSFSLTFLSDHHHLLLVLPPFRRRCYRPRDFSPAPCLN